MRSFSAPLRAAAALAAALLALAAAVQPYAVASPAYGRQHDRHYDRHYDRQGLIALTDAYVAALVAHDPSQVPLAHDVRTVENLQPIQPGEGLWSTTTGGPTDFQIHVPDPRRQTAGYLGVIEDDGQPALVAIRLQLDHGRIVQAEHLVATDLAEANLENLQTPRPGLLAEVPRRHRLPERTLRTIGATYYDALDGNDSSLAPFADDCERHENGLVTAGPDVPPNDPSTGWPAVPGDCKGQIDSQVFTYIKTIDDRRVFAADPVTGLAMGLSHFRQPMDNTPYDVVTVDGTVVSWDPDFDPFDLPAAHIFKVGADRRLHEIEAMGFVAPPNSPSGW
ncbi:hypothetical protein [Nocardioides sp. KR10-350]|uniref:hypothetical protein n=1 Tax=Nocardioides cheoyonin TaxID=3156615 RepID=UPI0032B5A8A3